MSIAPNLVEYVPPPTCAAYIDSTAPVNVITGPWGSGKTSASIMKLFYHAGRTKPNKNNVRQCRAVVIRNTSDQLRDTTIKTFLYWFPTGTVGTYKEFNKTYLAYYPGQPLPDGTPTWVDLEVMFRALDRPDDVRKLLSWNLLLFILTSYAKYHLRYYLMPRGAQGDTLQ